MFAFCWQTWGGAPNGTWDTLASSNPTFANYGRMWATNRPSVTIQKETTPHLPKAGRYGAPSNFKSCGLFTGNQ
jgi:hypothetical protein